jgi:catechol-2,3-dioxygenase
MITGFSELTLESADPEALARFYVDCFGLRVLSRDDDRIWLGAGDSARLGIWKPGEKEFGDEGGAHVHFAFAVEPGRLARLHERVTRYGLEVEGPHAHDGGDRSMYVQDPEGNVVEAWDYFERGRRVDGLAESHGNDNGDGHLEEEMAR